MRPRGSGEMVMGEKNMGDAPPDLWLVEGDDSMLVVSSVGIVVMGVRAGLGCASGGTLFTDLLRLTGIDSGFSTMTSISYSCSSSGPYSRS